MPKNNGGMAFPVPEYWDEGKRTYIEYPWDKGMTMRDWFAGQALKGLMSNPGGPIQANGVNGWGYVNCTPEQVAEICATQADAMLTERNKK